VLRFQPSAARQLVSRALTRPLDVLVRWRVSPNLITTLGVFVNLAAGLAYFLDSLQLGGALILLGGVMDIIDGHVARASGRTTRFGSFYDSTTDRLAEVFVFLGVMSLYLGNSPNIGEPWMVYVVVAAMAGSLMVSYTRAKAESLGIDCKVGLMQRAERIILLGGSTLIFGSWRQGMVLSWVMIAMAALTNLTALYRIYWVWSYIRRNPLPEVPSAPASAGRVPEPLKR
jgi:phosphatidylglycerophosphate synthase